MKNILTKFYFIILTIVVFTSCVVKKDSLPVSPVQVQLNITMADLEYVATVEGKSTQSYLLGILPIGGRRVHDGVILGVNGLPIQLPKNRGAANAYYDAISQKPDADFIMPVSIKQVKHVMFLGNKTEYVVKAKVFKLKTK